MKMGREKSLMDTALHHYSTEIQNIIYLIFYGFSGKTSIISYKKFSFGDTDDT